MRLAAASCLLGATGCISITSVNIGQKTSLERQLIGELEPLTEEEVLASSVRAASGSATVALDDLRQQAVAARRRQLFNEDEVEELEDLGCLGEGRQAQLASRPCDAANDPEVAARRDRLLAEENADRDAVIGWAIAADPVLTNTDRPQVARLYARLIFERAGKGHWLEAEDGTWSQKAP